MRRTDDRRRNHRIRHLHGEVAVPRVEGVILQRRRERVSSNGEGRCAGNYRRVSGVGVGSVERTRGVTHIRSRGRGPGGYRRSIPEVRLGGVVYLVVVGIHVGVVVRRTDDRRRDGRIRHLHGEVAVP